MPHYRRAAAIRPNDTLSNLNLAFYKSQHGDLWGALAQYKTVTEIALDERSRANAFANMGTIQHRLGHFAAARDDFQEQYDGTTTTPRRPPTPCCLVARGETRCWFLFVGG